MYYQYYFKFPSLLKVSRRFWWFVSFEFYFDKLLCITRVWGFHASSNGLFPEGANGFSKWSIISLRRVLQITPETMQFITLIHLNVFLSKIMSRKCVCDFLVPYTRGKYFFYSSYFKGPSSLDRQNWLFSLW